MVVLVRGLVEFVNVCVVGVGVLGPKGHASSAPKNEPEEAKGKPEPDDDEADEV